MSRITSFHLTAQSRMTTVCTMTTPNIDPHSLYKRLIALEKLVSDMDNEMAQMAEKIDSLQSNAQRRSSNNEEHAKQKTMIMELFHTLPAGFKMTVPTITENVDLPAGIISSRVGTLVREGKLIKHQEENKHPKFSRS